MSDKKITDDFKIMANDGSVFTVGELKKFLKEEKFKPSDLFSKHDLIEDPELKEAINQGVEFELEYRDQESEREVKKMLEEDKKTENELNVDLLPEGDTPPSGLERKQEKKERSKEDKEGDLLPPGDEETQGGDEEDQEENGGMLPG